MNNRARVIRWHGIATPRADVRLFNFVRAAVSADFRERNAVANFLRATGIPTVEAAKTPREHALGLLRLAAEVEHALLVQYLYARISITGLQPGPTSDPQLPPEDPARKQLNIAVEEMGHLATVQNLLLLVEIGRAHV